MPRYAKAKNLVTTLVDKTAKMIEQGTLKPGIRLPSIREAASNNSVSKNTMAEVYDRLVGQGYLTSKQGSGFYVNINRSSTAHRAAPKQAEALSIVSLLRHQLKQDHDIRVGDGRLPFDWVEGSEVGAFFRNPKSLKDTNLKDGYGSPMGYRPLRELISLTLAERSITATPDQILMTNGANHALDLVIRHLLLPGDTVLVDEPGYYPLFGKLKLENINMIGVRRTEDGPDLDDLADKATRLKPKMFFTQSLAQNPTGSTITIATAHKVLSIAEQHDMYVVEDDPFADVMTQSLPRIATLDQLERVIYIGTYSKTLSANLRVGYLAARPDLVAALCDLKMITMVSSSEYGERLIYNLMYKGHYVRHLRRLKKRIDKARNDVLNVLDGLDFQKVHQPTGGYYCWVQLPDGIDEAQLVQRANEQSIFLAPGSVFSLDKDSTDSFMRLNIAHAAHPTFIAFMQEILKK
ncbi:PLP-dependent aminotransferase family protein [Terasakiella pusilla]|uniref:aminotransferase-like domain-containing protein n=1 Tax=Terasakiella pusilla TaxID=64973 RepID=UPI00056F138A|nr:PLP-dependent aminotransferase family protein [Terasakiella pusilla]